MKKLKVRLLILFVVGVLVSGCSLLSKGEPVDQEPPENLLKYDFTGEIQDGMLVGWESKYPSAELGKHIKFEFDSEREEWILSFHRGAGDGAAMVVQSDPVPVTPGFEYEASGEVRSELGATPRVHIEFLDADGERIGDSRSSSSTSETWVRISRADVAPQNAVSGRIFFFLHHNSVGNAYFRSPALVKK